MNPLVFKLVQEVPEIFAALETVIRGSSYVLGKLPEGKEYDNAAASLAHMRSQCKDIVESRKLQRIMQEYHGITPPEEVKVSGSGLVWEGDFLVGQFRPHTTEEEEPAIMDWTHAEEHLKEMKQAYEEIGAPGKFALNSFIKIYARFENGERTEDLYNEILSIQ